MSPLKLGKYSELELGIASRIKPKHNCKHA